ncbi:MAG: chemotaxis protein [Planctomycetia bacterium]|nr:chemotaxis protein [Planctomycetia bacterium]
MNDVSPERIAALANEFSISLSRSLKQIEEINREARLLALNARIEAGRASGSTGAAFGVVARAMGDLSRQTDRVATGLGQESLESIRELQRISDALVSTTRGVRLTDLALVNIDLIDRNLYERSCDVRWWATDRSAVDALTERTPIAYRHVSERLGVILDSYTVYFDLVLCDLSGRVVANGRPMRYSSVGTDCASSAWFRSAMATRSGGEFGFEGVHQSNLVGGRRVLVYSAAVRQNGEASGHIIGVLGIVFNWDALAQTVVEHTPLLEEERDRTRVVITDENRLILADTSKRQLVERLHLPEIQGLYSKPKGFVMVEDGDVRFCVAHAKAPGFETYTTGWHSLLIYRF